MTKAERTLLCAVADLMLMIEPRGYVEGTDIGRARARLERARVSLEAEGLMGRVTDGIAVAAGQGLYRGQRVGSGSGED